MTSPQTDRANGLVSSVAIKPPCDCATTANITLSAEQTIDGVTTSSSRVLVKNQTDQTANGIYVSNSSAWSRATDCDGINDIVEGTLVYVVDGTSNGNSFFQVSAEDPITIGTSNITFAVTGPTSTAFVPTGSAVPANGLYLPAANNPGISANTALALDFTNPSSAVNWLRATGSITGNYPILSAQGTDTNIGLNLQTKGTGSIYLETNGAVVQCVIDHTASAVNAIHLTGSATGSNAVLSVQGSDSNPGLNIQTKGSGSINLQTNLGTTQFQITHTASAVNFFTATGISAGGSPAIQTTGSDSAINAFYGVKGAGAHYFMTSGISLTQFQVLHTASAVDYLTVTGGVAGSPGIATLGAAGTDTDIDIKVTPKGAGALRIPTVANGSVATALSSVGPTNSHTTVQEWFAIKNASGTLRYVPGF